MSIFDHAPHTTVDGETVWFAPARISLDAVQPAVTDTLRPRKPKAFEAVWGPVSDRLARYSVDPWAGSELDEALLLRLKARLTSRTAPEAHDETLEALALNVGCTVLPYTARDDFREAALTLWAARVGPVEAARTFSLAGRYDVSDAPFRVVDRKPDRFEDVALLRDLLRQYPAVRDAIPSDLPMTLRAWLLDEPVEAETKVRRLVALVGLEQARALLPRTHPSDSAPEAMRAVVRHGIALAPEAVRRERDYDDESLCLLLWAAYPSTITARKLVRLLADKALRKRTSEALTHFGPLGVAALEEALRTAKKKVEREPIEALLSTLKTASTQTVVTTASAGIPEVLAAPPWRARKGQPVPLSAIPKAVAAEGKTTVWRRCEAAHVVRQGEHEVKWGHSQETGTVGVMIRTLLSDAADPDRERCAFLVCQLRGQRDFVLSLAERIGGEPGRTAVAALLDRDPRWDVPAKPPKLFVAPEATPRVTLRDGAALTLEVQQHLLEMLAFSEIMESIAGSAMPSPYVGIADVTAACDRRSLGALVEGLIDAWAAAGMPSAHVWAVRAIALIGDAAAVRALELRIATWSLAGETEPVYAALVALGARAANDALGTAAGAAMAALGRLSRSARKDGVRGRAAEQIKWVAEARGLGTEELEDRSAPDLGLDERGRLTLTVGEAIWAVRLDELLRPVVTDASGAPAELPADAASAREALDKLASEAKAIATDQIARFERMLEDERRVPAAAFRTYFAQHPLSGTVARRLVWAAHSETESTTFRVAEDGTLATIDDALFELPEAALVGLAHPATLGAEATQRWATVLSDYRILQPFGQLARSVTTPEIATHYAQLEASAGRLFDLRRLGWVAQIEENHVQGYRHRHGHWLKVEGGIPMKGKRADGYAVKLEVAGALTAVRAAELGAQLESIRV